MLTTEKESVKEKKMELDFPPSAPIENYEESVAKSLISKHQIGIESKAHPSTLLHYISFEIWVVKYMINTNTPRQRWKKR